MASCIRTNSKAKGDERLLEVVGTYTQQYQTRIEMTRLCNVPSLADAMLCYDELTVLFNHNVLRCHQANK